MNLFWVTNTLWWEGAKMPCLGAAGALSFLLVWAAMRASSVMTEWQQCCIPSPQPGAFKLHTGFKLTAKQSAVQAVICPTTRWSSCLSSTWEGPADIWSKEGGGGKAGEEPPGTRSPLRTFLRCQLEGKAGKRSRQHQAAPALETIPAGSSI